MVKVSVVVLSIRVNFFIIRNFRKREYRYFYSVLLFQLISRFGICLPYAVDNYPVSYFPDIGFIYNQVIYIFIFDLFVLMNFSEVFKFKCSPTNAGLSLLSREKTI